MTDLAAAAAAAVVNSWHRVAAVWILDEAAAAALRGHYSRHFLERMFRWFSSAKRQRMQRVEKKRRMAKQQWLIANREINPVYEMARKDRRTSALDILRSSRIYSRLVSPEIEQML